MGHNKPSGCSNNLLEQSPSGIHSTVAEFPIQKNRPIHENARQETLSIAADGYRAHCAH
jgi:hypothetical protein